MPDVLSPYHEDHHLGDVHRMIPDSLEMFRDENEFEAAMDVAGIF